VDKTFGSLSSSEEVVERLVSSSISHHMLSSPEPVKEVRTRAIHVEDAVKLNQRQRLQLLRDYNKMQNASVTGILHEGRLNADGKGVPFWISQLQTTDGDPLQLPVLDDDRAPRIPLFDLPPRARIRDRVRLRINVVPDHHKELTERLRPFALIAEGDLEVIAVVELPAVIKDGSKVLIEESVWESEIKKIQDPLQLANTRFAAQMEQERLALAETQKRLQLQLDQKNAVLIELQKKVVSEENHLNMLRTDAEVGQRLIEEIYKQREDVMAAYQSMSDFARERARILHALDLISHEQIDQLTGAVTESVQEGDYLSWKDELDQDYGRAVSAIHAYLLNQGLIYPRWLIGDVLTLLRMNDLIILSGLSGAGKTQIVRSFADALGGIAHIIPVKPNWTGAEDLLGFFNPLQRSYVRTPFLDALLAARNDPNRLHFICLDEMNLARAEYYFADFLSALEERSKPAVIELYSESEESHIQAEVRMLLAALVGLKSDSTLADGTSFNLEGLIQSPQYMDRLRTMFGENAGESFPVFHGRVRRSLATVLDVPSKISVPSNVRFIGAINVDQTTYGLSPKILDRAHVIRFDNPLKHSIEAIREDVERHSADVPRIAPIRMHPDAFSPQRSDYPKYSPAHPAARWMCQLYADYLDVLGIDVAFRTIRQAQLFWDLHADVAEGSTAQKESDAKNLLVMQKLLPKFTMDGKTKVRFRNESEPLMKGDIVRRLEQDLKSEADISAIHPNMHEELHRIRIASDSSDKIFNYWA
jgi:hypothetical protein